MTRAGGNISVRAMRGVAAAVILAASSLSGNAAEPTRSGGFVPAPRKTREELVREWDLNSDGTIDIGEAEMASSRMRRERAVLRLNSGIDPLTGLPRGEQVPEVTEEMDDAADDAAAEPADEAAAEREDVRPLPGTRVPRTRAPAVMPSQTDAKAVAGRGPPAGSRAAADATRQPLTGGVRGGGMPARTGYGANLPAAPLNAGLPIVPKTRPAAPPPRGGLVPAPRQPPATARPQPPQAGGSRDMYDPY